MTQPNPYESPQVTELSERSDPNKDSNLGSELRGIEFLKYALGPEWQSVKNGIIVCTMAVGLAIAGSMISFIFTMVLAITKIAEGNGLEQIFTSSIIGSIFFGCFLHIVGLYNLRKVTQQRNARVLIIIAFATFLLAALFTMSYFLRLRNFSDFMRSVDALSLSCMVHGCFLSLGIHDLGESLQDKKSCRAMNIAIGLISVTFLAVFVVRIGILWTIFNREHCAIAFILGGGLALFFYVRGLQRITESIGKIEKESVVNKAD